ncbi:Polyprenol monophosphomannose synthase [bacterium HR11]|nr:Polyprenol monophosphomannose synthase [bacterium HR11]
MTVGVVIPTYNEAENLPALIERLMALGLESLRVIVVDDASPDGTGQVADRLADRYPGRIYVIHQARRTGLGAAYRAGFRRALQDGVSWVVQMDADLSHAPEDLPRLLEKARDADVVVGSRYVAGGGVDRRWPRWRRWLSRLGNLYARWVTGLRVRDATAGFKVFRRDVLERIGVEGLRSDGYAFQHAGLKVVPKGDGVVAFGVPSAVEKRHRPPSSRFQDGAPGLGLGIQFGKVPPTKLLPAGRVVAEPAAEFMARGDVPEPAVETEALLREAPGPQALDEKAHAVVGFRRVIHPLDPNHGEFLHGRHGPDPNLPRSRRRPSRAPNGRPSGPQGGRGRPGRRTGRRPVGSVLPG